MDRLVQVAVDASKAAGSYLRDQIDKIHLIEYKGERDIVTEADRKAEEIIIQRISSEFPDHSFLSEEGDEIKGDSEFRWIIDPLDGTTNYAHGFPVFCTSVAIEKNGEVLAGVVYNPMLEELFLAIGGNGAYLNDKRVKVSNTISLSESLLATGFPYDIKRDSNNNINFFSKFSLKSQAIRRAGAAALDLCYVACGRFDGFWELKLKPWDTAAGYLMIKEAGGTVTDFKGGRFNINLNNILATNGRIHKQMMEVLEKD